MKRGEKLLFFFVVIVKMSKEEARCYSRGMLKLLHTPTGLFLILELKNPSHDISGSEIVKGPVGTYYPSVLSNHS